MVLYDPQFAECPFYDQAPRTLVENLDWRYYVRQRALRNEQFQQSLIQMAAADILFFTNAFGWVFEPRAKGEASILPFIAWPHQEPVLRAMQFHLGAMDVGIEKSRGEGASWMAIFKALHDWRFMPTMRKIGFVSRNEYVVDSADDPDSLMWKLDWAIKQWPSWLLPRGFSFKTCRSYSKHVLLNPVTGSTIVGYPATGDVARGGRAWWFLMDELAAFEKGEDHAAMASTQHVTESRLLISTPQGMEGAYADAMHDEHSNMLKLTLHWKQNPTRTDGLYKVEAGQIISLDHKHPRISPERRVELEQTHRSLHARGFRVEGTTRSDWYDRQCLRPGATPRKIAQELDLDYKGSVDLFFDQVRIHNLIKLTARKEESRMRFWVDPKTEELKMQASPLGDVCLWQVLDPYGFLSPIGKYVLAADIAAGTGGSQSSNSIAELLDGVTGEQVLELATMYLAPADFARLCVAICKWAYNALLIPEITGPFGMMFLKAVLEAGYDRLYYRDKEVVGADSNKKTRQPGFHMQNDEVKATILGSVIGAAEAGLVKIRSKPCLLEFTEFGMENGRLIHRGSQRSDDQADKGKAHADRAVAMAIGYVGMQELPEFCKSIVRPTTEVAPEDSEPPLGTMARRIWEHEGGLQLADPWSR